jgi:hypothetical protein
LAVRTGDEIDGRRAIYMHPACAEASSGYVRPEDTVIEQSMVRRNLGKVLP